MTPCNNTKCDHYETYEYDRGTLKFPFTRDAKQDYSATRKGDKMHVVMAGVIICPMCREFKGMNLCTVEEIVVPPVTKPKKAKKKGK